MDSKTVLIIVLSMSTFYFLIATAALTFLVGSLINERNELRAKLYTKQTTEGKQMGDFKEKLRTVTSIRDDLDYLRDEYKANLIWGSQPDGGVHFESLLEWMAKNDQISKMMIDLAKKLDDL